MNHLTDTQIQEYADLQTAALRRHVESCSHCRAQVAVYAQLGQTIARRPQPQLADEIKTNILSGMLETQAAQSRWEMLVAAMFLLLGAGAIFYFYQTPIVSLLTGWPDFNAVIAFFKPLNQWVNFNAMYVSASVVVLAVYHLVERLISGQGMIRH